SLTLRARINFNPKPKPKPQFARMPIAVNRIDMLLIIRWTMIPGVVFLNRCAMKGTIQVVSNMNGTLHHLKAWKKAHKTP
ncbi:MAG: hypothetical protein O2V44_09375, partial [Candidatus Bathyarchaeota archaeon]|nr:hypothetical protein [Candidatus Bathyarchaeota archaeon]